MKILVWFACILLPLVSVSQTDYTISYDTTSDCERDSQRDSRYVQICFGYGFQDSLCVKQDSLSYKMLVMTNDALGGAEVIGIVRREYGYITIAEVTGKYSVQIMVNPGFGVICLNRRESGWSIVYANCPPVLE